MTTRCIQHHFSSLGSKELNGGKETIEDENVSTDDEDFNDFIRLLGKLKKQIKSKQVRKTLNLQW